MPEGELHFSKPFRLSWWAVAAFFCLLVLLLLNPSGTHVVLAKGAMLLLGLILGFLAHHTLMPYNRPSGYLSQPWEFCMYFQENAADHRIVPGYEMQFAVACVLRVACMLGGAYVMGLGV